MIWYIVPPSKTPGNIWKIDRWWRNWCDPRQSRSHTLCPHHRLRRIRGGGEGSTIFPHRQIWLGMVFWAVRSGYLLRTGDVEVDAWAPPRHLCWQPCNWHIGPPRQNVSHAHRAWLDWPIQSGAWRSAEASCRSAHVNHRCNASHDLHQNYDSNPSVPNNKREMGWSGEICADVGQM